jgi:preprotein translocase subunit SecF
MRLLKLIPDDTNIDWMRWRNVAALISLLLVLGSIALVATRGLNLGVDFVGGQQIRATFDRARPIEDVRTRIADAQLGDCRDQRIRQPQHPVDPYGRPRGRSRGGEPGGQPRPRHDQPSLSGHRVRGRQRYRQGSEELAWDGGLAVALAMLGIAIYIWFPLRMAVRRGRATTLFHDVIIVMGFFSLTQLEFNLNVVAAILTIVGYSLNDTVVIYDRIRENLRKFRKMEIVPLLNLSLNETLSRTIVTSLSIMLALLMLLIFGPIVIFGLTAAILFGTVIGTYSSIYVSAPMLIWLKVNSNSFLPKNAAPGSAERVAPKEGYS